MGDVRNLLARRIISAIMIFFLSETSLTPAIFVSNRHFRKKWASGKSTSQRLVMDNTINFLFGSCASCMNVIYYLFILINLFIYLSSLGSDFHFFFQTYYMLKQTETVQNC